MPPSSTDLVAADVFAGGGGLTVGLKRAGFRVASAVEIEPHAYATYKANHPEVRAFKQDVRTLKGADLVAPSPTGAVDVLAGCPPCQGFTSLTSKYRREDARNDLIVEMARLVEEVRPRAVMMENVPGLTEKGKALFREFVTRLVKAGYILRYDVLQVADFGVPQSRRRLVLLAGKGFAIRLPKPTHHRDGLNDLPRWRHVGDVIRGMPRPVLLDEAEERGGPATVNWHVTRRLSDENKKRIRAARVGQHWKKIPKRFRPTCHQEHDVGFQNVYGRMRWASVSPTITGGCTTFSKGRFGHPTQDRTISVREAALLQTFPADYVFDTPYMEYVCNIVGNALPCDFAEALARQCASAIRERDARAGNLG